MLIFTQDHDKEFISRPTHKISKRKKRLSTDTVERREDVSGDEVTGLEPPQKKQDIQRESDSDIPDSAEEGDSSELVHESLSKEKGGKGVGKGKARFVPSEETPELRRARTIFVGNVPVEVVKSKVCHLRN